MAELLALDRQADVLRRALTLIGDRLPDGWLVEPDIRKAAIDTAPRVDALITVTSPRGERTTLAAEVKGSVSTRDLRVTVERMQAALANSRGSDFVPLVIARYLPAASQDWLTDRGVSYADATGNIRLSLEQPTMFLRDVGASKDPWRGPGRPRGTLKGEPAARVVRALADCSPPMTVPELIQRSGASSGATYRVVEFLEAQTLIEREPRGPITVVRWRKTLERWAQNYGFLSSNTTRSFLQPRGLSALTKDLTDLTDIRYAVTGSLAAQAWAPYAQPRLATIYADDTEQLAASLGLREVESGANVLIASAAYDVVFDRSQEYDGVVIVSPSQAVVDLMSSPGRSPTEAQSLFEWMEANPDEWRT